MPKVSIVIPIYGVEKYLRQCLDSVLSQTLKDIEIILVDDGSKDACPQICDEYAQNDKRITVIHKENSGYGHSINMGISKAHGDFIGIVDADDWVDSEMFESLYKKAIETDAEIVKSSFWKYSGQTNQNKKKNLIPQDVANKLVTPLQFPQLMHMAPSIWSAIYKKDFLMNNNIRLLETPGASYQDTGFHFKSLLGAKKAYFLDQAFYHYRTDNAGSSVKDNKKIFCICDEWAEIIKWAKESNIYNQISGALCAIQYRFYMWNWKRLSGEEKKQFLKCFSEEFIHFKKQNILKKEHFKIKDYQRLKQIMYYPRLFEILYELEHFPSTLLKKLKRRKNG